MFADPPITDNAITNLLGCSFNVGWFYVYKRVGDGYQLVFQDAKLAQVVGQSPRLNCIARAAYTPPDADEYRLIVSGRSLFGPKYEVGVLIQ